MTTPLVEARALTKKFPVGRTLLGRPRAFVHAVTDVDVTLVPGETLALVGESGCGKSTLGRLLLRLIEPTSGDVRFEGRSLGGLRGRAPLPSGATSRPSKRIVPESGATIPTAARASVDFPQPDSPTSPTIWPRSTRTLAPATARTGSSPRRSYSTTTSSSSKTLMPA